MPKITVHGGPSNAKDPAERPGEGAFFQDGDDTEEEEAQPSAGTSFSTSSPRTEPNSDSSGAPRHKRAPTTASRSKQRQTGSSTAQPATSSGRGTATR